jgi:hypothetical protein
MKMLVTFWWGSRLGLVCRANVFFVVRLTGSYFNVLFVPSVTETGSLNFMSCKK